MHFLKTIIIVLLYSVRAALCPCPKLFDMDDYETQHIIPYSPSSGQYAEDRGRDIQFEDHGSPLSTDSNTFILPLKGRAAALPCPPPLNFRPLVDWTDSDLKGVDGQINGPISSSPISHLSSHTKGFEDVERSLLTNGQINSKGSGQGQGQYPVGSAMQFARNRQ